MLRQLWRQREPELIVAIALLRKTACDVVAMDGRGQVVAKRRWSRAKLVAWLANVPRCLMGMEAACGAHHLARRLSALGHDVRLLAGAGRASTRQVQQARSGRRRRDR